ncbi:hypothetical protein D3C72_1110820 [compost metagenome]
MRINNPQLRILFALAQRCILAQVQRVALQLRVFAIEPSLVIASQWLGSGQRMTGATGITTQTDLNLPGQVDQLLAVQAAFFGCADQQLPPLFISVHPKVGAALAVADHFAVIAAAFGHPELQLVHGGGQ